MANTVETDGAITFALGPTVLQLLFDSTVLKVHEVFCAVLPLGALFG